MDEWQDGRVKLATTALLLALRREEPELFDKQRLSAACHRGRSIGLGLWLCSDFRRPKARCRDGALSRASRGGARVERAGAIAGGPTGSTCFAAGTRSSTLPCMSGCIRCRSRSCWLGRRGVTARQLTGRPHHWPAIRLLRHTLEQQHGARGHFVDSADVELARVQLRVRRVKEPLPSVRFIAGRQGELDGLMMGVEHQEQRRVRSSPLDARRLPAPVQQHAEAAQFRCPTPRPSSRSRWRRSRTTSFTSRSGFISPVRKRETPQHRVEMKRRRQATEEVHERQTLLIHLPMDPADLVVLAIGVVVAVLRPAELVAGADHRRALRQDQRGEQIAELTPSQRLNVLVVSRPLGAAVP